MVELKKPNSVTKFIVPIHMNLVTPEVCHLMSPFLEYDKAP